jgi:FlgN protein
MSRQISELEQILQQLIVEHRKLLGYVEAQQAAMKKFDVTAMGDSANAQEACRLRIGAIERRRRLVVTQLAAQFKLPGNVTVGQIAKAYPPRAAALLQWRDELKGLAEQICSKAFVAGKVAGAVLGHLNTVVRLLAGAVEKAGVYNKHGVPQVSKRIGVMEAVG